MRVRVDKAGQQRQPRQVDHFGVRRNGEVGPDVADALALHQNDLVGSRRPVLRIDDASGADRGQLLRPARLIAASLSRTQGAATHENHQQDDDTFHCSLLVCHSD